jgi:hypothetical protein
MPRFFFNLSSEGNVSIDETGMDFPSLETAYLDTCEAILEMGIEKLRARQDPSKDMFEIADGQRNVLMQVPFFEVLRPVAATSTTLRGLDTVRILHNRLHQVARSEALQADIRAEYEQAKKTCCDIRTNLARMTPDLSC